MGERRSGAARLGSVGVWCGRPWLEVFVAQAVAVAFEGDDFGVVDEPVDHGGSDDVVAEDLAPRGEGLVAGDDQAGRKPGGRGCGRIRRRPEALSLYVDEAHSVLTPSVATLLAEGRSAGLEACFAWQFSAQIRDELVRSGVRSLLQSISIFRMREMEDARSLASLAMEVYSDRISVDQEEQERLRFSPDDIVKLPTHRALNVWVARGIPRGGFLGATLPMEDLRRDHLADHHLDAQRQRGGHHPEHLPDPLRDVLARGTGSNARDNATSRGKSAKGRRGRGAARDLGTSDSGDNGKEQLTFIDVTDIGDRDDEL